MYSKWLALPLSTRQAIAKELGIAKTGSTHVVDNRIESDGYNIKTVEDALEAHEGDWDDIVARAEGRMVVPNMPFVGEVPQIPPEVKAADELGAFTMEEVFGKPKKKTTRAKPARRKGK